MRRSFVAGNWKMKGTRSEASDLIGSLARAMPSLTDKDLDVAVFPPYILIPQVFELCQTRNIDVGSQDIDAHMGGAYTGAISGNMLVDHGCKFVLVGHSERRHLYGEDDMTVGHKVDAACRSGLKPVICVGETLRQREASKTTNVIEQQINSIIESAGAGVFLEGLVAYEPVWAIGTGKTATPGQVQEIHALIRDLIRKNDKEAAGQVRILYGGSVKPDNASNLFKEEDVDGGLIGGASLNSDDFLAICRAA